MMFTLTCKCYCLFNDQNSRRAYVISNLPSVDIKNFILSGRPFVWNQEYIESIPIQSGNPHSTKGTHVCGNFAYLFDSRLTRPLSAFLAFVQTGPMFTVLTRANRAYVNIFDSCAYRTYVFPEVKLSDLFSSFVR